MEAHDRTSPSESPATKISHSCGRLFRMRFGVFSEHRDVFAPCRLVFLALCLLALPVRAAVLTGAAEAGVTALPRIGLVRCVPRAAVGGAGCRPAALTAGQPAADAENGDVPDRVRRPGASSWLMTGVAILGVLFGLCMLIYIGKVVLRLVAFVFCLVSGAAAVKVLGPWLREVLPEILPARIGAGPGHEVIAGVAAFLVGYLAALVLIGILAKPLRAPAKSKS